MEKIVISRYRGLYAYLVKKELIEPDTPSLSFAKAEDVRGKHVFGVVPLWLAAEAVMVTEVQIRVPQEKRKTELSLEEIEFYAIPAKTYRVTEVK